jgi:hypothetical protein
MSSLAIPLTGKGWNLVSYPIQETRPVTEALVSIEGKYRTIYGYVFTDTLDPWKMYDLTAPAFANDLRGLQFPNSYWINLTDTTTLQLKPANATRNTAGLASGPPASYYGPVLSSARLTPKAGMMITAWIDGYSCGQTRIITGTLHGQARLVYALNVPGANPAQPDLCGQAGRTITFTIAGQPVLPQVDWSIDQVREVTLNSTPGPMYFPLIFK